MNSNLDLIKDYRVFCTTTVKERTSLDGLPLIFMYGKASLMSSEEERLPSPIFSMRKIQAELLFAQARRAKKVTISQKKER